MNAEITKLEDEGSKDEFFEGLKLFFVQSAKAWQSYVSYEFIKNIKLSTAQKEIVNSFSKQAIINGSAGSGKSIVLLYKLIKLMKENNEKKRFIYITYNKTLIDDMKKRALLYPEFTSLCEKHDVFIGTFHQFAKKLLIDMGYKHLMNRDVTYKSIETLKGNTYRRVAGVLVDYKEGGKRYDSLTTDQKLFRTHDEGFIRDEILWMKANGYIEKESYMQCERAGRGTVPRLTKSQRNTVFSIYEDYQKKNENYTYGISLVDLEDYALELLRRFDELEGKAHYDAILIDETQDLDAMQLKFLVKLNPGELVLAIDPKQRIYKRSNISYAELGIEYKGRVRNLSENFRSTKEIMKLANSLDFTDIEKDGRQIKYMNSGDKPEIYYYTLSERMLDDIGKKIRRIREAYPRSTIAVITRDEKEKVTGNVRRIKQYLEQYFESIDIERYGQKFKYNEKNPVIYTDVYNVKGLEFDYVFLLQFDKIHYPISDKVRELLEHTDKLRKSDQDYIELINAEKKLLYVAMSRAKKKLEIYCSGKTEDAKKNMSEFINDFGREDFLYYEVINKRRVRLKKW